MSDKWGKPGKCASCGKRRNVIVAPNPFTAEVWPDEPNPPQPWCEECYTNLKDDV